MKNMTNFNNNFILFMFKFKDVIIVVQLKHRTSHPTVMFPLKLSSTWGILEQISKRAPANIFKLTNTKSVFVRSLIRLGNIK